MTAPAAVVPAKAPSIGFGQRGLQLLTLDDAFRFSKYVVASGLAPKSYKTAEQVLVAIQAGAEVGFGPMQALQAVAVIGGVPRLMVEPALALVLASGLLAMRSDRCEGEGLKRTAVVALVRKGGLAVERTFSVEDAKRAGLENSNVWRAYPDRMLYARALGYALHDLFPDVLRGMRVAETMDDYGQEEPAVRSVTPRPAELGPDPLALQLESGSQGIELAPHVEAEPVPVSEESSDAE